MLPALSPAETHTAVSLRGGWAWTLKEAESCVYDPRVRTPAVPMQLNTVEGNSFGRLGPGALLHEGWTVVTVTHSSTLLFMSNWATTMAEPSRGVLIRGRLALV